MKKQFCLVVAICLLAGCQSNLRLEPEDVSAEKLPPLETRTWIAESCLITSTKHTKKVEARSLSAALAGVLLPKVINYFIDSAIEDLNEVKKLDSGSHIDLDLYNYDPVTQKFPMLNNDLGCMTTITARFDKGSIASGVIKEKLYSEPNEIVFSSNDDITIKNIEIAKRLEIFGIILHKDFEQILEADLEPSADRSSFRLAAKFFQSNRLLGGKRKAEVIYSYDLLGPGSTPNGSTYLKASLNLGAVVPGTRKNPLDLASQKTGWMSNVGMTDGSIKEFYRNKFGDKPVVTSYSPATLIVKNTQIVKPSDAAKFLSSILSASKETVTNSIVERVLPADNSDKLVDARIALKAAEVEFAATSLLEAAKPDTQAKKDLAKLRFNKACSLLESLNGNAKECDIKN